MNILQVIPEFGLAGAETMCEALCYEIQRSGKYNLFVASLFDYHSPITDRMEQRGINMLYLHKKPGIDVRMIWRLYRLMKEKQIDIVHTHRYVMQYVVPAAIMAGVKVKVHTVHNIASKELGKAQRFLAKYFYKHCNVTPISISPLVQKTVMEEYKLSERQTPMVYNGSDLRKCIVKAGYVASDPFTYLHIGRFSPVKNHRLMVEAAKRLKSEGYKFKINFVGGAGNEEQIKQEVKTMGLESEISFCGLQSNVYPYLSNSDCFILPSAFEGMPISLIEAMGTGLPIIASAVGGIPDMLQDGKSAILINPTTDELVDAMKKVYVDETLRETLGRKAHEESRRFSAEQMFKEYDRIYSLLAK